MVCGQPDPKMNENKSRENEKQTEGNKDSPVMSEATDLPTVLPEALSILHI